MTFPTLKRSVILQDKDGFTMSLDVEARAQRSYELGDAERLDKSELVAEIMWLSRENNWKTSQSNRFQPVNSIELRAFGVVCIELAKEMEDAQGGKRR